MDLASIMLTIFGYTIVFLTVFYAKKKNKNIKSLKEKGFFVKILNYLPFICITPIFIYYIYEYINYKHFRLFILPFPLYLKIIGILILFISLYLYTDSIIIMRKNWTIGLELRKKHHIIHDHAFKYIRHPIYAAWLGIIISLIFIFSSFLYLPSLIIVFLWYFYRAKLEESFLSTHLKGYKRYMQKTKKMFIPFIF